MKILFSDLDGTLLTTDKRISDRDLASIRKMTEEGHLFVIATGRPLPSVLKLVDAYELRVPNVLISCFNGSLIYDPLQQKKIRQTAVSFDHAQYIFDAAAAEGLHVHTYSDTHVVSHHDTKELAYYLDHIHMPGLIATDVKKALDHEPFKLIVMSFESRERLMAFQQEHEAFEKEHLSHTFSCDWMLEYGAKGASKGASVAALCDYFHVPLSDSLAIGDEENDISMIEAAGTGFAMINATDPVRERADRITQRDNDHDALTEVIEGFIL